MGTGNRSKPNYWAHSPFRPRLAITALGGLIDLDSAMALNDISGCVNSGTATVMVQEY